MQPLYQGHDIDTDRDRTNLHYAKTPEFFLTLTGGAWNVYSCNLWETARTQTESQEAKLHRIGAMAGLKPGQRILDVGCGWGGPLVYLCKTFGVSGVGLTLSEPQRETALARARKHGADVQIIATHWQEFQSNDRFDLIYSDEVLVHIHDLSGLFRRLRDLVTPGGSMIHKELHLTNPVHAQRMTRGSSLINEVFGATGNYRTLAEELSFLGETGWECRGVHTIPQDHYRRTIGHWIDNMKRNRARLIGLEGEEFYKRILGYLIIAKQFVTSRAISNDIVHAQPM